MKGLMIVELHFMFVKLLFMLFFKKAQFKYKMKIKNYLQPIYAFMRTTCYLTWPAPAK
jgi:hypothetical protein